MSGSIKILIDGAGAEQAIRKIDAAFLQMLTTVDKVNGETGNITNLSKAVGDLAKTDLTKTAQSVSAVANSFSQFKNASSDLSRVTSSLNSVTQAAQQLSTVSFGGLSSSLSAINTSQAVAKVSALKAEVNSLNNMSLSGLKANISSLSTLNFGKINTAGLTAATTALQKMASVDVSKTQAGVSGLATGLSGVAPAATQGASSLGQLSNAFNNFQGAIGGSAAGVLSFVNAIAGLTGQGASLGQSLSGVMNAVQALAGPMIAIAGIALFANAISSAVSFIRSMSEASEITARFRTIVDTAFGTGAGVRAFEDLSKYASLSGGSLKTMLDPLQKMSIAAKESGLTLTGTTNIMKGFQTALTAQGASTAQAERAFTSLTQMFSKGTVQSEELKGQLGESLPGAFGLAAKAMNLTTSELQKFLEDGKILASDLLPKMASLLQSTFGDAAKIRLGSLTGQLTVLENNLFSLQKAFGEGGLIGAAKGLANGLSQINAALSMPGMDGFLRLLGDLSGVLTTIGGSILATFVAGLTTMASAVGLAYTAIVAVVTSVTYFASSIAQAVPGLSTLASAFSSVISVVAQVAQSVGGVILVVGLLGAAYSLLSVSSAALGVTSVGAAAGVASVGIAARITALSMTALTAAGAAVGAMFTAIGVGITSVVALAARFAPMAAAVMIAVSSLVTLKEALNINAESVSSWIGTVKTRLVDFASSIDLTGGRWSTFKTNLSNSSFGQTVSSVISSITTSLSTLGSAISQSTPLATALALSVTGLWIAFGGFSVITAAGAALSGLLGVMAAVATGKIGLAAAATRAAVAMRVFWAAVAGPVGIITAIAAAIGYFVVQSGAFEGAAAKAERLRVTLSATSTTTDVTRVAFQNLAAVAASGADGIIKLATAYSTYGERARKAKEGMEDMRRGLEAQKLSAERAKASLESQKIVMDASNAALRQNADAIRMNSATLSQQNAALTANQSIKQASLRVANEMGAKEKLSADSLAKHTGALATNNMALSANRTAQAAVSSEITRNSTLYSQVASGVQAMSNEIRKSETDFKAQEASIKQYGVVLTELEQSYVRMFEAQGLRGSEAAKEAVSLANLTQSSSDYVISLNKEVAVTEAKKQAIKDTIAVARQSVEVLQKEAQESGKLTDVNKARIDSANAFISSQTQALSKMTEVGLAQSALSLAIEKNINVTDALNQVMRENGTSGEAAAAATKLVGEAMKKSGGDFKLALDQIKTGTSGAAGGVEKLASESDRVATASERASSALQKQLSPVEQVSTAWAKIATNISSVGGAFERTAVAIEKIGDSTATFNASLGGMGERLTSINTPLSTASQNFITFSSSMADVNVAMTSFTTSMSSIVASMSLFSSSLSTVSVTSGTLSTAFATISEQSTALHSSLSLLHPSATSAQAGFETLKTSVDTVAPSLNNAALSSVSLVKSMTELPSLISPVVSAGEALANSFKTLAEQSSLANTNLETLSNKLPSVNQGFSSGASNVVAYGQTLDGLAGAIDRTIAKLEALREAARSALAAASAAGGGGVSAPAQSKGGYAGQGPATSVSASAFNNAPSFAKGVANTSSIAKRIGGGGIPAILHPNEAVVPLPGGRSIPVDLNQPDLGAQTKSIAKDMASTVSKAVQTATINSAMRDGANTSRLSTGATDGVGAATPSDVGNSGYGRGSAFLKDSVSVLSSPVTPAGDVATDRVSGGSSTSTSPVSSSTPIHITMNIYTDDADSFRRSQTQIEGELYRSMRRSFSRDQG